MDKTLNSQTGISIVEIMITIIIIAVTTLLILYFSRNSVLMNTDARATDSAYFAAEQKISDLRSEVFTTTPVTGSDDLTLDNINFTRSWTVDKNGYILLAKIIVNWETPNGTREITLAGAVN